MSLEGRLYLVAISLVVLARHVSVVRPALRGAARLLLLGFCSDLARRAIRLLVLDPWRAAHGRVPLDGWSRVAGHVSQGLFLAWSAGILALCIWTFTERRSWIVAGVLWCGATFGAVIDYPALRDEALGRYYRDVTITVVILSGLCVLRFLLQRRRPRAEHVAAFWMLAIETSLLLGPYLGREPFTTWWTAQIAFGAMLAGLIPIVAWGVLWNRRS